MTDRARAISILQEARWILVDRLTARIVETGDEIINDAEGGSYTSELESIYDEIGARLAHVSGLLSNLPPEQKPDTATPPASDDDGTTAAEANPAAAALQLDAPQDEEVNFQVFVRQVTADDLDSASTSLAELLDVDVERARRCAKRFHSQLTSKPDFLQQAMKLRTLLHVGRINDSLMLLWECFGLQGSESIGALQSLKVRMRK